MEHALSSLPMMQVYRNKSVTSLEASSIVRYPVPAVILHLRNECFLNLINHGYGFPAMLTV